MDGEILYSFISGLIVPKPGAWCSVNQQRRPEMRFVVPGVMKLSLSQQVELHSSITRLQSTAFGRHLGPWSCFLALFFQLIHRSCSTPWALGPAFSLWFFNCSHHRHIHFHFGAHNDHISSRKRSSRTSRAIGRRFTTYVSKKAPAPPRPSDFWGNWRMRHRDLRILGLRNEDDSGSER